MNYKRIYDQLIERGRHRILEGYVERHHIIPRCMKGQDHIDNLVALTPEEHYVAHLLLVKIHPDVKALVYAANMMGHRVANNKQYGWIKRRFALIESQKKMGHTRTLESRQKQSNTLLQKYEQGYISPCEGRNLTEQHKQAISTGNRGKTIPIKSRSSLEGYILRYGEDEGTKRYNDDKIKKISMSLEAFIQRHGDIEGPIKYNQRRIQLSMERTGKPGTPHTLESKQKISQSKIGKKVYRSPEHNAKIGLANKGKKMPTLTCVYCGLTANITNIKRWHNNNCKHR